MKRVAVLAVVGALGLTATGCGASKFTEQYKDAPRSGFDNTQPADTIEFPDGFSNVATKCDHGNRLYVLFHNNYHYGAIAVVPNAKDCNAG